ncbi:hypothetical protein ACOMHN_051116 [Nucella lapillus]
MGTNTLLIGNERIPLNMNMQNSMPTVGRVTASRRAVIPPNSVVRLSGKLDTTLGDYYIEPVDASHLFIPRTFRKADECPVVCLVNLSDQYQSVKKGQFLANAYEVQEVLDQMQEDLDHGKEGTTPDHVFCGSVQVNDSTTPTTGRVPEHLQQLAADSSAYLTVDQREELGKLLSEFEDVFAKHDFDLGEFTTIEHAIDTGDAKPIKQGMRRTPAVFVGEEEAHLRKMLDAGVTQESISEWASAPVLIRKKDGMVRWCIDYRALNDVTVKDTFPLPLVNDCLDALSGSTWFSKLDANSAYWQIKVKAEDRRKTAFLTKYGLFEHVRMGFGLTNAPATFSRAVNLILQGLTWKTVLAFLDDVLVLGNDFHGHHRNLQVALQRFRKHGMKLKPKKCLLF